MSTGAWVLIVAVALALGFGLYRGFTDGRFRGTHRVRHVDDVPVGEGDPGSRAASGARAPGGRAASGARAPGGRAASGASVSRPPTWAAVHAALPDVEPGERATLVQFSSAFCAPCRATRRVLDDVAGLVDGVRHIEIDAEHHLPLVRELGIRRTPTTLVLAADGHELSRATGVPTKPQVIAAIGA